MSREHALGRLPAGDQIHALKYPLQLPRTVSTVERTLSLPYGYRRGYDQGSEGACVGFALSWAMSILNRRFYDALSLYKEAQRIDEWAGEDYSGTSVRAGCDVLRDKGHKLMHRHNHTHNWEPEHGIEKNTWTSSVDAIRSCLAGGVPVVMGTNWYEGMDQPVKLGREWWMRKEIGRVRGGHAWCIYGASDKRQAFRMVNSWGLGYPLTMVPYTLMERLLNEDGEATVITDRITL